MIDLSTGIVGTILLTLRVAPALAFSPPFNLTRIPGLVRGLLGIGLAAAMVAAHPVNAILPNSDIATIIAAATRELALGMMFFLVFQIAFGALYIAGRTVDVQAGFGLALLIDPTSRNQTPLVGTLFALAAAAIFFALDGHLALFRLISATVDAVPIGTWIMPHSLDRIALLMAATSSAALGFAGGAIVAIFLIDLAIAFLARTVPQMNVLVLGFQVKTLVLLLVLPLLFSMGGVLLIRLLIVSIEAIPEIL